MFSRAMNFIYSRGTAKIGDSEDQKTTPLPTNSNVGIDSIQESESETNLTQFERFFSNEVTLDEIDDTNFLGSITPELLLMEIDFMLIENPLNTRTHDVNGMVIEQYDVVLSDGTIKESSFENALLNGYGKIIHPNGINEIGFFIDGVLDKGKMIHPDGEIQMGFFKDSLLHGKGFREIPKTGKIYKGNFEEGLLNGIGFLRNIDGTTSKGIFKNDELNGLGIISFPNGGKYKGTFKGDLQHGMCEVTFIKLIDGKRQPNKVISQYIEGQEINSSSSTLSIRTELSKGESVIPIKSQSKQGS